MPPPLLVRADRVAKAFAGVRALRSASFELQAGEVHALVGENGAGKSTFIKILTGVVQPDAGEILIDGRPVASLTPRISKTLGIAAIYQQPALFPELTVAENLAIGIEGGSRWRPIDWRMRHARARDLLERVGARIDPQGDACDLSMPEQQLVEIARALGANARMLILDEPTASLSSEDAHNLFRALRELRAQGVGMIYISHRLDELPLIADRVTVLRDGRTIETLEMSAVSRERLIRLMVGRELADVFPKRRVDIGEPVIELRHVGTRESGVTDVSIDVRAGEIVGLAGLVGAGRTELARTIFGLTPADSGEIRFGGEVVHIGDPGDAIALGIAYVPEDRLRHGVVPEMAIAENITLATIDRISRFGAVDYSQERELASECVRRLGVKAPSIYATVSSLSGGNQQKVALARWLLAKPRVLILDEPTQGIDVGAKSEIHTLMCDLAAEGVAILMISSELPEILGMSDRIAVMRSGRIVAVMDRYEATQERVLAYAFGEASLDAGAAPSPIRSVAGRQ
jgi:rhamnose transport system ATP-binding protein